MERPLDNYDILPPAMRAYLSHYGFHFSKAACMYAISLMRRKNAATGKIEPLEAWDKEQVDDMLKRNNIKLEQAKLYDYVYYANMLKADNYKGSLEDEKHLCMAIKEKTEDIDASDETIFRQWLAKMVGDGNAFDWADIM